MKTIHKTCKNLLIPCSGPGTRSAGYTKFHKTLNRVGPYAVIDHIIASYTDIDTIYITLGYEGDRVREYLTHAGYKNIEFIEIANWNSGQIASFKQIPEYVFDKPFYYNACDNWSTLVPLVDENTWFVCYPENSEYYDSDNCSVYSGISFIKDSKDYYRILQDSNHSRNDLLILKELNNLNEHALDTWYDVGNRESSSGAFTHFEDEFLVLDKSHQEVYKVNDRIIKLFSTETNINVTNTTFPHPSPVICTPTSLSYEFVNGDVNPYNGNYDRIYNNLENLWTYCLNNNVVVNNKELWQDKTWQRFEMMCDQDEKYGGVLDINGVNVDCTRLVESINWDILNNGILGPCHGDLVLDNIVVTPDSINYIDHRAGVVNDIFYDICKFYHSLWLHNINLNHMVTDGVTVTEKDLIRLNKFRDSDIYKNNWQKIELGVGAIWLSMAPLNVDAQLNHQLFLWSMQHLHKYST